MICTHYEHNDYRQRCTRVATHRIVAPSGKYNPGGFVCAQHGVEVIDEYRTKLFEFWDIEPTCYLGHPLPCTTHT